MRFFASIFDKNRSVPNIRTDLLKVFDYWEIKYVFPEYFAERVSFDYSDANNNV